MPKHDQDELSRRQFLKRGAALAGAALAAPWIVPASALGADGFVAPSNRIVMGSIGVGGMGTGNTRCFLERPEIQLVAVCDVDREHLNDAKKIVDDFYTKQAGNSYKSCATYGDFRELLARPDIDVITTATPDHWHALIACAAARAGKDMYAEKPLALTIEQGRIMSDTMKRHGRVFQTGSWQRSQRNYRFACELVRNERIGKLQTVKVGLPPAGSMPVQPEQPVPPTFNYDMWLGPAPYAPYNKARCHWNFRYNFDYSGGHVTDWGAHNCDIAHWGMGMEHSGPSEVWGQGEFPRDGYFNVATDYKFECLYANGVHTITSSRYENGIHFEGSEGWVFVNRERIDAHPRSLLTTVIRPDEIHLYESSDHYNNFIECVKTRRETIAPVETAHRSITVAHLGNIAMLLGRKVRWNPERECFVDDPEADRMRSRAMRGPWQL